MQNAKCKMNKAGRRRETLRPFDGAHGSGQAEGSLTFEFRVPSSESTTRNLKPETRNHLVGIGLSILLAASGCGYGLSAKGEAFPNDVQTVFVETLINRTRAVGVEGDLTAALKGELRQKGQLRVVDRLDQADAIISGVVRSYDSRAVGVNRHDEALQYELTMVLDMNLRRRAPDEVLWRTQGIRFAELYSGSRGAVVTTSSEFKSRPLNAADVPRFTDVQLTETLKQEARERLMNRAARDMLQRLLEMS